MTKVILWYLALSLYLYALPAGIEAHIKKSGISKKDISIYIKEVGTRGKTIASLNANTTRTPASVIKVLTTYAAILKLGFNYKWPTKFYTTGKLSQGVLHGDLIIKGFGDPTLCSKNLESISGRIRASGISKITGNIIIDRSYFSVGTKDSSKFDESPYSPYNAMPDAMMFNERVSTICVTPNKNKVSKKSADYSYKIVNQLQRVNKPCKGRYSWPRVKVDKSQSVPTVLLQGKISQRCGTRNICRVVTKPYKSFYYALKDRLKEDGVQVVGNLRLAKVPSGAKEIFVHYSDSLKKIVSKTSKKGNNLYARQLLLFLGAKVYGAPSTIDKGRRAVEYILRSKGALSRGTLKIDNGSGLSRSAKMSAKILADMYDNAYERYGQRWMNTLSVAGIDGTIRKRFRGTIVKNRAWMKTGTLRRIKNIGGYVKSRNGKLYTVVILTHTTKGKWRASKLQNDIMDWLVRYKSSSTKKTVQKNYIHVSSKPVNITLSNKKSAALSNSSKKYYKQVGVFSNMPDKVYLLNIKHLGLPYKVKNKTTYRVLVGPYKNKKSANSILPKVHKYISKGAFIVKE